MAERPEIGLESDTSCVTSVQFVAMAFICNGFGNLDGNKWENTGGDNDCESEGGDEEGNDEGANYNGCAFGVGTGGNGFYTNGATGDSCDGIYDGGCIATTTSSSGTVPHVTASASTSPTSLTTTPAVTALSPSRANGQCNSKPVNYGPEPVYCSDKKILDNSHPAMYCTSNLGSNSVDNSKRTIRWQRIFDGCPGFLFRSDLDDGCSTDALYEPLIPRLSERGHRTQQQQSTDCAFNDKTPHWLEFRYDHRDSQIAA